MISEVCIKKRGHHFYYICTLRSSTTYAIKYMSKAHAKRERPCLTLDSIF